MGAIGWEDKAGWEGTSAVSGRGDTVRLIYLQTQQQGDEFVRLHVCDSLQNSFRPNYTWVWEYDYS